MKKISTGWFIFWQKKKFAFWCLIVLLMLCSGFGATQLSINEDISRTLPKSDDFEKLGELLNHKGINSGIYFSIKPGKNSDTDELRELGASFVDDVERICKGNIVNLRYEISDDQFDIYSYIGERIPYYLEHSDYEFIDGKIHPDSINAILLSNHQSLFTPESFLTKEMLIQDPLGITFIGLKKFLHLQSETSFIVKDGLFMLADEESLFITGDLKNGITDPKQNAELANQLEELASLWDQKGEFDYFSSFLISNSNAEQIKKDSFLTGWISITAILLLLFVYYRSLVLPLFFVVPAVFGLILAVGAISVFRPEISAISMGAGAIVLGIIMDYSFHFFTHLKHSSSIEETLRDITHPLLIGSFTTVLAFLSLTFTNSPVLQDFGIFAACSLIGSLLSVLFILPIILPAKFEQKWKNRTEKTWKITVPGWLRTSIGIGIVVFSVIAFYFSSAIQFDDDISNLNYYPESLKQAETKLNHINPDEEKRIFILTESANQQEASQANFDVLQSLKEYKEKGIISNYMNPAIFDVSDGDKTAKLREWNLFWAPHANRISNQLDSMETRMGYYEDTFDPFKTKISGDYTIPSAENSTPAFASDLNKLIDSSDGAWKYLSYFTVKTENKDSVAHALQALHPSALVIDRGEIATSLIKMVKDDFTFILLTSSLVVFISLLIVYGRIELALITFIPMVLSWTWILGIAALLGIKFNFINIIISTFIFGLGDDFAIFITDGFVNKFARNKDVLSSYRKGILLSAATTIIGTGVLIFAKHPAINSIAILAVIGMVAILIISFTVQPYLLKKLLIERKEKKLPPVSLINFVTSVISFTFFVSGCLFLYPIQFIFKLIPFGQNSLKLTYHKMMHIFCWMQVYFMFNVRKKVINRELLDFSKPSIIIANHQSFIDLVMMMSLHPKLIIMTNDWVYNSKIFGAQIRYLGFFPGSNGLEKNITSLKPWIEQGYSVLIFPEGTRSDSDKIGYFHKGAFYLSKELKLDITPVLLHGFNDAMRKHDFILLNGKLSVVVLPRIAFDDLSYGTTYQERTKSIAAYLKSEFKRYEFEHADSKYQQPKIISNYLYKSPFIEWYVKIKWMFERKNFDFYHTLIPASGKIFDLGCGYGYLSYYLHFRSNTREIIGVDYDEEKVEIANNCYSKNKHVHFLANDVRDIDIKDADAIFMNDVLHYFPAEEQEPILEKCIAGLSKNGVLIIRDGVIDLQNRHKKTELTEKYSTQIIGFNKTKNQISFFSKEFILSFAEKNGLTCEVKEQSESTSNILFILRHEPN